MPRQQSTRQGQNENRAVAVVNQEEALRALSAQMDSRASILQDSATSLIDPTRLKGIILSTFTRTPTLWDCDPVSIARAVVEAAQVGLMPTGSLGGAYLVPFFNTRTGKREAQLIIAYTGLVQLARRSGEILKVEARVVRKMDEFDFGYGLVPYLTHRPAMDVPEDADNPMTHAYAVATFKTGATQFDVMTAAEILAIRARSKAGDSGPWVTDPAEMWKKTVSRRLCKMLPLTVEAQRILDVEDDLEREARPSTPRVVRPVAPSRIASRITGQPVADEAAATGGDPGPTEPRAVSGDAVPATTGDVESSATAPSPDDSAAVVQAAQVEEDGTTSSTCGSPSPYAEGETCAREAGHAQNIMCRDANAIGTWPKPEGWVAQ